MYLDDKIHDQDWEKIQEIYYDNGKHFRSIFINKEDILFKWLDCDYILFKRKDKKILQYGNISGFLYAAFFSTITTVILIESDYVVLHGSLIDYKGKKIAVSGFSGAGKTTISSHLLLEGAKLISDDIIAIRKYDKKIFSGPPGIRIEEKSNLFNELSLCLDEDDKKRGVLKERADLFSSTKFNKIDFFFHLNINNDSEEITNFVIQDFLKVQCLLSEIYCKYLFTGLYDKTKIIEMFPTITDIAKKLPMLEIMRYPDSDPNEIVRIIKENIK
ncbi:hypothetical protein ACO1PF_04870 [Alkalibacterium sp. f15]|uniref:hypothetical protein n=1 Tax=Alkalibacterium sp. f15 TaxID=3414029 RepID=UPI003BF8525F